MIRTVIVPEQQNISIHLPINFVGKKVEVLLYTLEEATLSQIQPTAKKKPSDFAVTLSSKAADEF